MFSILTDWFTFWIQCILWSWNLAYGWIIVVAEGVCLVLWLWYRAPAHKATLQQWEECVKGAAKWIFFVGFFASSFLIAPYAKYSEMKKAKEKLEQGLPVKELKSKAFTLADQVQTFGERWSTNKDIGRKNHIYWVEKYEFELQDRVREISKMFGERGMDAMGIESKIEGAQTVLNNAREIRRLANTLKD